MTLIVFSRPLKFIEKIHNYEITLNEAIEDQTKLKILINKLNNDYNPRNEKKAKEKNRVLKSTRKLSDVRDEIIISLKKEFFRIKIKHLKQKKKKNQRKNQKKNQKKNF